MDTLSSATETGCACQQGAAPVDAEVARLRAQVARLQAERAALSWAVGHDELTGLVNRRLFGTLAPSLIDLARPSAVIVLDLDGFKPINDMFGHNVGDDVLRLVARRLATRTGDGLAARLGGDEFAGVLTCDNQPLPTDWWRTAVAALWATVAEPMFVAGRALRVAASIGVAPAGPGLPVEELLHRADLAMYRAKATGCGYAAWNPDADGESTERTIEFALFPLRAPAEPTPLRRGRHHEFAA